MDGKRIVLDWNIRLQQFSQWLCRLGVPIG
jgi:hypothetical protein